MTDISPTPGQVCYEAYMRAYAPEIMLDGMTWERLTAAQHHAWEAAAQAVRAMKEEEMPCP